MDRCQIFNGFGQCPSGSVDSTKFDEGKQRCTWFFCFKCDVKKQRYGEY